MRVVLVVAMILLAGCSAATTAPSTTTRATTSQNGTSTEPPRTWPAWVPDKCDPNPKAVPSRNAPVLGPTRFNETELARRAQLATGMAPWVTSEHGPPLNGSKSVKIRVPGIELSFGHAWPSRDRADIVVHMRQAAITLGYPSRSLGLAEPREAMFGRLSGVSYGIKAVGDDNSSADLVDYDAWIQDGGWVTTITMKAVHQQGGTANLTRTQAVAIAGKFAACRNPAYALDYPQVQQALAVWQESQAWDVNFFQVPGTRCASTPASIYVDAVTGAVLGTRDPGRCLSAT